MPEVAACQRPPSLHVLRLKPGEDLRQCLAAYAGDRGLAAAFVLSAVGSLSVARLRFAGRDAAAEWRTDLEIVALSGTLGGGEVHLHLAASDGDGQVRGGHLLAGSLVRTTAEVVLGAAAAWRFVRRLDAATGYRELVVERVGEDS